MHPPIVIQMWFCSCGSEITVSRKVDNISDLMAHVNHMAVYVTAADSVRYVYAR